MLSECCDDYKLIQLYQKSSVWCFTLLTHVYIWANSSVAKALPEPWWHLVENTGILSLAFCAYCLHTSRLHCTLQLYVNTTLWWLVESEIGESKWQSLAQTRYLADIWHTTIIHMFTAVLFSQILEMCYFEFVYAVFCDIYRLLLLAISW